MQSKGISDLGRIEQLDRLKVFLGETFVVQDCTHDQIAYLREHAPHTLQPSWLERASFTVLLAGAVSSPFIFFFGCVQHVMAGNGWIVWAPAVAIILAAFFVREISQALFLARRRKYACKALDMVEIPDNLDFYIREGTAGKEIIAGDPHKHDWQILADIIQKVIVHPPLRKQLEDLITALSGIAHKDDALESKDELYEIIKRGSYYHDMAAWEQKEADELMAEFKTKIKALATSSDNPTRQQKMLS